MMTAMLDKDHETFLLTTPRFGNGRGRVNIDQGIVDIVLDIWDLENEHGYCRTYASCEGGLSGAKQGQPYETDAYVMFQYGFTEQVLDILWDYGKTVTEYQEDCHNSVWPPKTWSSVRWVS